LRATPAPALPDVSPETSTQLRGDLMVCRLELNALARLCQRHERMRVGVPGSLASDDFRPRAEPAARTAYPAACRGSNGRMKVRS